MLDKVLIAPLRREISLRPLVVDVEQGDVVASGLVEVFPRSVCVDDLVLRSVEDARVVRHHRGYGQDLGTALVLLAGKQHLAHHGVSRDLRHSSSKLRQLAHVVEGAKRIQLLKS